MTKPIAVLHVHAGNLFGGIERILLTLAAAGDPGVDHAFALCFDGRMARTLDPAIVTNLGPARLSRPWSTWRARRRLRDRLQARPPNVVFFHAPWAQALFGEIVRKAALPTLRWHHGAPPVRDRLERLAARHPVTTRLANSRFTTEAVARALRAPEPTVLYPPVAPPDPARRTRAATRASLGARDDVPVVLLVSRMERGKGHHVLLEALATIGAPAPWHCWIVGAPHGRLEERYHEELGRLVAGSRLGTQVRFLGDRSDVASLYAAADLYCQPNVAPDAFGLTFIEALYAGLPIITSALGGPREIVTAECGMLVPAGDRDALVDALRHLLTDGAARRRLGNAGPARAAALCDPSRRVGELHAFIRRCL